MTASAAPAAAPGWRPPGCTSACIATGTCDPHPRSRRAPAPPLGMTPRDMGTRPASCRMISGTRNSDFSRSGFSPVPDPAEPGCAPKPDRASGLDDLVTDGVAHQGGGGGEIELAHGRSAVGLYRL